MDDEEIRLEDDEVMDLDFQSGYRRTQESTSQTQSQSRPLNPNSTTTTTKTKGQRSLCWDYFTKVPKKNPDDDNEETYAQCNYCGKKLACAPKRSGTSSLLYHGKKCMEKKRRESLNDSQQHLSFDGSSVREGGSTNTMILTQWNEEKLRRLLIRMIIIDELPFRFVEKEGFVDFIRALEPRFRMPSRITAMRIALKMYLDEKEKLKKWITSSDFRICLTTDTWTSIQNLNYMCITAHFIDEDWKLHKKILNFVLITGHKGVAIAHDVEQCLIEWGINGGKIFSVTVDNASSNDVALQILKNKMKTTKTSGQGDRISSILDNEYLHVRCMAHILNLIVVEGLKEHDVAISRIRNAVKYVKASPARMTHFKQIVDRKGISMQQFLVLDVPTRWNSTYKMLEIASRYRIAFQYFAIEDGGYEQYFGDEGPPLEEHWDSINIFADFLKVFYDSTVSISATKHPTANIYFQELASIWENLQEGIRSENAVLSKMANRMLSKYNKYYGDQAKMNKLMCIACVLEPTMKLEALQDWWKESVGEEQAMTLAASLKELIEHLYDLYSGESRQSQPSHSTTVDEENTETGKVGWMKRWQKKKQKISTTYSGEFEKYLNVELEISTSSYDVLTWWKVNQGRFPILVKIARDVLAIPISTVASESTFSTGGRVLDAYRSSLAPKTVDALICVQDWLKTPISIKHDDFLVDNLEGLEIEEDLVHNRIGKIRLDE